MAAYIKYTLPKSKQALKNIKRYNVKEQQNK